MKSKARKRSAPRNPFVAVALFKKAGTHAKSSKSQRRQEKVLQGRLAHTGWCRVRNSERPPPPRMDSKAPWFRNAFCSLQFVAPL